MPSSLLRRANIYTGLKCQDFVKGVSHYLFTANPFGVDGIIELRTGDPSSYFPFPLTNRVGYENGTQVSHQYSVSHFGDINIVTEGGKRECNSCTSCIEGEMLTVTIFKSKSDML